MEVLTQCRKLNTKTVAGGPLFIVNHEEFEGIDHFVIGEAEAILPPFLFHRPVEWTQAAD